MLFLYFFKKALSQMFYKILIRPLERTFSYVRQLNVRQLNKELRAQLPAQSQ